jgi:CDP-glucose 4,6-dehydratase
MEIMEMKTLFGGIYKGKKVLVTGHTGFKGSWLAYWLGQMGADVFGIALEPPTQPNHISNLSLNLKSTILDINDKDKLEDVLVEINPDIVFHLAAQPLVRLSYDQPYETYLTNIIGTVNVLNACRKADNLKAIIIVTSDKCYDNKEWIWGYRENEAMGGKDPYSASKGCAEIVTASFRDSFFNPDTFGDKHHVLIASGRAGNVIGGGDWAQDRIVTDMIKAASTGGTIFLRYPNATRPWQHVLEPISGYLMLGWRLLEGRKEFSGAWNFGPDDDHNVPVLELVKEATSVWQSIKYDFEKSPQPHEAGFLMLDSTKAKKLLKWSAVWSFKTTVQQTIHWYQEFYNNKQVLTMTNLEKYIGDAHKKGLAWTM